MRRPLDLMWVRWHRHITVLSEALYLLLNSATEFNVGNKDALKFLAWNLLAGVIICDNLLFHT